MDEVKTKRTYYGLKLLSIFPSLYSSTLCYQQQEFFYLSLSLSLSISYPMLLRHLQMCVFKIKLSLLEGMSIRSKTKLLKMTSLCRRRKKHLKINYVPVSSFSLYRLSLRTLLCSIRGHLLKMTKGITSFAIEVQPVWSFKICEAIYSKPLAISPCC